MSLLSYDPLLHEVDVIALRKHCLNFSDYEALGQKFPVVFTDLTMEDRVALQEFEDEEEEKAENLRFFLARFGSRVDCIFIYGEFETPQSPHSQGKQEEDFRAVLTLLDPNYELLGVVRLYQRKDVKLPHETSIGRP